MSKLYKSYSYVYKGVKITIDIMDSYPVCVGINYLGKWEYLNLDYKNDFVGTLLNEKLKVAEMEINATTRILNSLSEIAPEIVERRVKAAKEFYNE